MAEPHILKRVVVTISEEIILSSLPAKRIIFSFEGNWSKSRIEHFRKKLIKELGGIVKK